MSASGEIKNPAKTVAIIFFAVIVRAFALTGTFKYLAVFATGSLLLIDLGVSLAVLVSAAVAVYVIRVLLHRGSGKPKPTAPD